MKSRKYLDEIIDLDEGWYQALRAVGWPPDRKFVTRAYSATQAGGAGEKVARMAEEEIRRQRSEK